MPGLIVTPGMGGESVEKQLAMWKDALAEYERQRHSPESPARQRGRATSRPLS